MVERLRVAIVTSFPADPSRPHGGVEAVSLQLVRALARYPDLELEVVTLARDLVLESEVGEWQGVRIHRLRRHPRAGELRNALGPGRRQIQAYLARLAPDLIHAHDTYGLMVQGMAVPRIFTVHGFIHGDTLVSGRKFPRLRARLWRFFETRAWADQHAIVSISPYVREYLRHFTEAPLYDICNPVDPDFYATARRPRVGVVFSAAVISPRKNTLRLVQAVERLRAQGLRIELRLAGPVVDPDYGARVERYVRERRLEDQVIFLGALPTERVRAELAEAQVFALVSLEENAPMGIAEAMAAGVPVVASNRCGMPYMVMHGETGYLVDPEDPADIARRLAVVVGDEDQARRLGENARRLAETLFHPERVAARTRTLYLELAPHTRGGGGAGR
jgi:glycosyltransferase involved in cell wall biosynthesis